LNPTTKAPKENFKVFLFIANRYQHFIKMKEDNDQGKTSYRDFFSSSDSSTEVYMDGGKNDIKTYVQKRFEQTKKYYKKRSNQYGRLYIVLQIIIISIGAFIPIINAIYPSNNIANALPPSSVLGAVIE
jgi:hypothetical protein